MNYIIFDLEFNNAFNVPGWKWNTSYEVVKDEIIEIGAVNLNDSLETINTFNVLIKP